MARDPKHNPPRWGQRTCLDTADDDFLGCAVLLGALQREQAGQWLRLEIQHVPVLGDGDGLLDLDHQPWPVLCEIDDGFNQLDGKSFVPERGLDIEDVSGVRDEGSVGHFGFIFGAAAVDVSET